MTFHLKTDSLSVLEHIKPNLAGGTPPRNRVLAHGKLSYVSFDLQSVSISSNCVLRKAQIKHLESGRIIRNIKDEISILLAEC